MKALIVLLVIVNIVSLLNRGGRNIRLLLVAVQTVLCVAILAISFA